MQLVPSAPGYYLLYLDCDGKEMTDTWHESVERAMDQATYEFGLIPEDWVKDHDPLKNT